MASNTTDLHWNATKNSSECLVLQAREFIPWNNSDNIVSAHTTEIVTKLNKLAVIPITALIGVPANIINMLVFYKHGLKERINVCLFALSLADGLFLLFFMVNSAEQFYLHFTTKETYGPMMQWINNNHVNALYGLSWVSQVLSAIVASERCLCILQPMKSQAILRTKTMTVIIVAIFIVLIGFRILITSRYYIICAFDPASNRKTMTGTGSEFYYRHKEFIDILDGFLYGLSIPWVVIIVVMVTTIITVIKLRQAAEWRAGTSSSSDSVSARDIALTRMLVGNSIFFIVCVIPVGMFRVSLLFLPEMSAGKRHHNMFVSGLWLSNIFSYINSTFNIIIYYTMGSRYRHTVHTMLGRKRTQDTSKEMPTKISSMSKTP